jgi:hypothetical protein
MSWYLKATAKNREELKNAYPDRGDIPAHVKASADAIIMGLQPNPPSNFGSSAILLLEMSGHVSSDLSNASNNSKIEAGWVHWVSPPFKDQ